MTYSDGGSWLGERRARTAGTFCLRAIADVFGGSACLGLGNGMVPAPLTTARALPIVPNAWGAGNGWQKRGARGELSGFSIDSRTGLDERAATPPFSADLARDPREDDGCNGELVGELERAGMDTLGTAVATALNRC